MHFQFNALNQSHVLGVPNAMLNLYELAISFKHEQLVLERQKSIYHVQMSR